MRGVDGGDAVGHRGHDAHPDPRPAEAAEPEGLDAEVEQVLLVGRHQHRGGRVGQRQVGVVGQGRRLGGGVVADEEHGPAAGPRAHEVGVLQHVARPVEARSLAVPGADDAVDVLVGDGATHLRAPHGGGRELLVEAGAVDDPVGVEAVAEARRAPGPPRRAASPGSPTRRWRCRARRDGRGPGGRPAARTPCRPPTAAGAPDEAPRPRRGRRWRWRSSWTSLRRVNQMRAHSS